MYTWVDWVITGSDNGLLPDGTKPLPEPMVTYCQLDPKEPTKVQFKHFDKKNAFEDIICWR